MRALTNGKLTNDLEFETDDVESTEQVKASLRFPVDDIQ